MLRQMSGKNFVSILVVAIVTCALGWMLTLSGGSADAATSAEGVTYVVAYTDDYAPFSYGGSDGNPLGMAISVMDYIAQAGGFQIEYVTVGEAQRYDLEVDINLAILESDQLEAVSTKSIPYTSLQMTAVGEGTEVISDQSTVIGHLPYYYLDDSSVTQAFSGATVYTYSSYLEMSQAYLSGAIDYMLVSSLVADQLKEYEYSRESHIIPTSINLDFYLSYGDHLSQEEMDALDDIILATDSRYVYNLMLNSVIATYSTEVTVEEIVDAYALPILLSILFVVASIAIIMLRADQIKRKALENALDVDGLTGLMTERKFMSDAITQLTDAAPGDYYIITIDIDHFKFINEIYGYDIGSQAIVRFGEMLQNIFPADTTIARFFADNFVVLYHNRDNFFQVEDTKDYEEIVAKSMVELLGEDYRLTTSSGIYQVSDTTLPLSYMIDCANVARRRGKTDYGMSRITFTQLLEERMRQKNEIVRSMERAIEDREFQIYYQPKISLETGALVGAEALLRWIQPDGHRRFPDEFIPLFESNGFIRRVDFFVLDSVCQFLQTHPDIPKVSVNFSGITMLSEGLVEEIQSITQRHSISPHRLEIEITESAVVQNFEPMVRRTTRLKELGFAISMDDFGAGISCLNRLKDLDIDVLKIDKGFLTETVLSPRSISIIQHIVRMSQELGITTVAEGVEYQEQERLLKDLGCDVAQGYHYARPLPEEEYLAFLEKASD